MKRICQSWVAGLTVFLVFCSAASAGDGFSGAIHFRNGETVSFYHLGGVNDVIEYTVEGYLGAQQVNFRFSDVAGIVFSDPGKAYFHQDTGTIVLVSKSGEQFTLSGARVRADGSHSSHVRYAYSDPVTRARKDTLARVQNNITSIEIGEHKGSMKYNPETGAFFPPMYLYDPFTGDRLEWRSRPD